ncbi:hypothetical protein RPMA_03510 [Tardiphaga alba]|uniref:Uncharacterized protein n=1 Tax=Tardiphaga alba TaxID=340268 RepID=A0ABX8A6A6_9BRAD|nr:hypothetical protein [Tardiphaga alba]QUS38028.1 hypothetical protein RPMA_03510 [Tardiphaga alba]
MKRFLIGAFAALVSSSASADTYNYICKENGQTSQLKVDDTKNILQWKDETYRLRATEDCAKYGWRAEKDGIAFDFCTATQGYADFQYRSKTVQCNLQRK